MIRVSSLKRVVVQRRLSLGRRARHAGLHIIFIISIGAIFFTYIINTRTPTPNLSHHPLVSNNNQSFIVQHVKLTSYSIHKTMDTRKEIIQEPVLEHVHNPLVPPMAHIAKEAINISNDTLHQPQFDILKSTDLSIRFEKRAKEFFEDGCKVRFFMIWMSTSMRVFGDREFMAVDSLFKSNPDSCLMILSNTMDSDYGFQMLKPVAEWGFRVQAITPDLVFLFKNTPAQYWLNNIKNGKRKPGKIPLAQNLSNLVRLAVLYKYGGVYIDTDFVVLKDFSSLHNSIGAQSATRSGNWTRLNNAVLIFDKNHSLLYKFMEEFASTFNGNKWGYNGPYLVSRVVEREATKHELNFRVLPPKAFYPVDWMRVSGFFTAPVNQARRRWIEAKVDQLNRWTYGVHLWNKQSSRYRIEEGSVMAGLIRNNCVICNTK